MGTGQSREHSSDEASPGSCPHRAHSQRQTERDGPECSGLGWGKHRGVRAGMEGNHGATGAQSQSRGQAQMEGQEGVDI